MLAVLANLLQNSIYVCNICNPMSKFHNRSLKCFTLICKTFLSFVNLQTFPEVHNFALIFVFN
jgi:hypothetical protein